MTGRRFGLLFHAATVLAVAGGSATAQTIIIDPRPVRPAPYPCPTPPWPVPPRPVPPRPVPPPPPPRDMALQVKKHHVDVSVVDGVAVTHVDQVFFNPHCLTVEGTYIFPLGDDVALSRFSMFVNGREIEGKLLDVEEARRTYESIVARMRDPALLEYLGTRMFRARIFPINPRSEVRVRLSYTQMLEADDGLLRYRYPLTTARRSGTPIESVSILAQLESAIPIKSVFCPSHKIAVTRPSDFKAGASYEGRNVFPDKNFELYYALSDKEFGLTVLAHRQAGRDGFFLARIAPPANTQAGDILPKDISFVVDTSGSMAGEKMSQAKEALKFCLANLNNDDRFNIVPFSHEARRFRKTLAPATVDNVEQARAFVEGLRATGGTNINDALLAALEDNPDADAGRPYLIVFLTDGQPTIGVTEPDEILKNVAAINARRVRLFVFGVGHDVNTRLLDVLAERNRGARDYVEPGEDLELKLSSFYRKVSHPVLADLSLTFGGLSVHDIYPFKLGDLFGGSEVVVVGRYAGAGAKAVELTGTRRGVLERFVYETVFPSESLANDFLPRLWATRKVGYLLDEMRLYGENKELKETVVQLATQYGIVTPYTAYLVTEPGSVAYRRTGRGNVMLDALAADVDDSFALRDSVATFSSAPSLPGGRRKGASGGVGGVSPGRLAVATSRRAKNLREAEVALDTLPFLSAGEHDAPVAHVGTRTFYRVGNKWVDSVYERGTETAQVELFSKAYFELLRANPDLAKCFALGKRVVVVVGSTVYETVPSS